MRLSSVRSLKEEIVDRALAEHVAPMTLAVRGARGARVEVPKPKAAVALGVAPIDASMKDFALAVRAFPGQQALARQVIRAANLKSHELDVATGVRYAPRHTLRAGGSCGHFRITAGTLGGFVEDESAYYVLSNNHVLANSDLADVGDPILAPGPVDISNRRFKTIAHLTRWTQLSPRRASGVDAAVAALDSEVTDFYPWHYQGIGAIDPRAVADRFEVSKVVKKGRTTGVTRGRVSAYELDGVVIDYAEAGAPPRLVSFDDQLEFVHERPDRSPFSQGGDSGSFILDAENLRPYALLYGGGPDDAGIDRTLGHFMVDVLGSLNVSLVT
jgi:hypothetical protein